MYCSKCGKELTGTERFCPRCGNKVSMITENDVQQTAEDNVSSTKSKNEEYKQKKRAGRIYQWLCFYQGHVTGIEKNYEVHKMWQGK